MRETRPQEFQALEAPDELQRAAATRRRTVRWLSLGAGILVLALGVVVAMNLGARDANGAPSGEGAGDGEGAAAAEAAEQAPIPVEVAAIARGELSSYISATANLVAEDQVTVISEVEGRVASLAVEEGDVVRAGELLAVLDREDEQMALAKAQARFDNARLAYERAADLFAKELLSREDHDQLKADYEVANQELAEARWRLEKNTFRAPFGGRVTERMIQVGQHVRPGDEVLQITQFEPLIARIYLPEADVVSLAEGREVRIVLNADPGVRFAGRVRQISPIVDTETGTVKVTIEAVAPPPEVRPGSFVAIGIVRETRAAVILPKQAVVRELQASHVFVALDGKAVKRNVELGIEEGDLVEALSGVEPGEMVVTAGQGGLKDGEPIRVLGEAGDAAAT